MAEKKQTPQTYWQAHQRKELQNLPHITEGQAQKDRQFGRGGMAAAIAGGLGSAALIILTWPVPVFAGAALLLTAGYGLTFNEYRKFATEGKHHVRRIQRDKAASPFH